MAASFGTTPVAVSTGISSYLITVAIFIPASAWLSDRFGARTVFACAIAVFTIASVLCGMAETLTQFTAARVLQGIGGAMMSPVARIEVMRRTHPTQLLRMIAFVTWPGLSALVVGPPLGGLLTTYLSWRWIFYINLPIGIIGIILVLTFFDRAARERVPPLRRARLRAHRRRAGRADLRHRKRQPQRAARRGARLRRLRPDPRRASPSATRGGIPRRCCRSRRSRSPRFRSARSRAADCSASPPTARCSSCRSCSRSAFGMTAFASGLLVGAYLAGDLGIKVIANRIVRTFGFRNTLLGGTLFVAAASAPLLVVGPQTPLWILVPLLVVIGASRSVQFTALNSLVFADLPPEQISSASALNSMSFQVCAGIGVGLAALVLALSAAAHGGAGATLTLFDFRVGLGFTLAVVAAAALAYIPLSPHTGTHVTGHRPASRRSDP